jgi:hypothetical protein
VSDLNAEGPASPVNTPAGAGGGMPAESDLPGLQGLDESVNDPDDPAAAAETEAAAQSTPVEATSESGSPRGSSDPMPDMSGSGGS